EPQFHFTDITAEAGIDFVHHGPTVDPKLDNIAPLVSSLGASVSVADVNNDGWPDLYFTHSRFGYPNALYPNRGAGKFVDTGRAAGPLRGGLLPLRHRLLAREDHAHHGEQLRVRNQRGQEPPVPQSRGRALRGRDG